MFASVLGPAVRSLAAESEEDVRRSREHYKKGEEAFAGGQYGDAYREFEAGYALVPRPLFLLNMAHSERRRGQLRKAFALYKRYLVVEPETKFRADVASVIKEIEGALAAEEAAQTPPTKAVPLSPGATPASAVPAAGLLTTSPRVAPDASRPVYKRWWFWTAAGGIAIGVVVAGVLLSGGADYQKTGSLGTLGMK